MKILTRVIAACALLAVSMVAQRGFEPRDAGSSTPPDPATMVAHQVERLTRLLTLTTVQASQATTIFTNALTATTALQTTLSTDRTSLQAAVKANATSTIDTLSTSIGTLNGQILAIQSKADAAFYAILTTAQQAILDARGGFHGGFGRGPGGPPPGRP
jgi:Spy/CpxP family protein refolding chaperone